MDIQLLDIKMKLITTTLLVPSVKSTIALLLIIIPFSQFIIDLSFLKFILGSNHWATSPNSNLHLDHLFPSFMSTRNRLPFLILYFHFTVVLGSLFCNAYQASQLLTRSVHQDLILISSPEVISEVHINLIMSILSLLFHLLSLIFINNPSVVSALASAQIGMELALFYHFNLLIQTIHQATDSHHIRRIS